MNRLLATLAISLTLASADGFGQATKTAKDARAAEAQAEETAKAARAAEAQAATAYEQALKAAETEQRAALEAVEAARGRLRAQAAVVHETARAVDQERRQAMRASEQEMQQVQRELERAHESLRRATREVARVHRDINRPQLAGYSVSFGHEDRAVIGVILGDTVADGVEILGVSPDGPAERAGVVQGDVIVSLMGEELAGGEEDARAVLGQVMEDVKVGDELQATVLRDGELHEVTVSAEKREPYTWVINSRLSSLGGKTDTEVFVETIELPSIDRAALAEQMEHLREELDRTRIAIDGDHMLRFSHGGEDFVYEMEEFSDLGDAVLAGTNMWFGMPMTRGLKMAELEAGLGEYFNTDRGVLVLKARSDNELQLQAGDVILSVGGTPVSKPADVVRALRELETGTRLDIEIMRGQENQTLSVDVPENRWGRLWEKLPAFGFEFHFDHEAPEGQYFVHPDHD